MHLFIDSCNSDTKALVERFINYYSYLQFNNLLEALYYTIISINKSITPIHLRYLPCIDNFPEPDNIWNFSSNDVVTISLILEIIPIDFFKDPSCWSALEAPHNKIKIFSH